LKDYLLAGFALMLIFEGLMPLIAPKAWKETFRRIVEFSDGQLRFIGLCSIAGGGLMLFFTM
jgi:hypothetical protein